MIFPPNQEDSETISRLRMRHPAIILATWFGLGYINPGPGTWGTIGALPFGLIFLAIYGQIGLMIAIMAVTLIGYWAAHEFEKQSGIHDSKMVVIDEVAGMWIALLPVGLNPFLAVVSFVAFRVFDIAKPWPASFFDKKVGGACGVMGDDIVAGLLAALCVIGVKYAGFG